MVSENRLRIVVLISGNGSNLQAIINANQAGLPIEICAVISNRPKAYGLHRAASAGIAHHAIDHTQYANRKAFDAALKITIDQYKPDFVLLAGFMRVLTNTFARSYRGRMLNIHPSLLPKYRGLNTHAKAIAAGDTHHGASVHFVTETLDSGPVVVQTRVPILTNDTIESLSQRVQQEEHKIYVEVLHWLCQQRLVWQDDKLMLDDKPLLQPVVIESK
ncbi:MAG: phosphoribosylglycinamide formyltransferase [Gammaproteobacteria bacterium]|nr:phosphoribosylglycinamide formyltransferase [Gammaproteobacteria bacterium]